ncbi:uncharacterized protein LOC132754732 isoform X1 [Ruditapes philippinarum]|uniref:uncharacterized protein LOC132754732 isoform X1 n=1 Tax=Ruditapes philippinarum TaxID=129788 RepID=UPI00295C204F|nr:uncharacterized protein LOC132754732 isoform X1 [Ruditapes philippinarum]
MPGNKINKIILTIVLAVHVCTFYVVNGQQLHCWHCVADDCSKDPADNYKASEKLCSAGQSCQKVYFEMEEENDEGEFIALHTSTVRGCSHNCIERNDFVNCTKQLKTSRGCVRKNCCDDDDLCNSANKTSHNLIYYMILLLCLFRIRSFIFLTRTL